MRHHSSLLAGRKEHDPVLKEDVIPSAPPVAVPPMMDETFECFQSFIEENLGIKLPPAKKIMLEARLARRVRAHRLRSFEDYCEYVFSEEGFAHEIQMLIDAVTTNETDFFREPEHYKILAERVLPELLVGHRELNLWSVAASTGQEAYTMAMVVEELRRSRHSHASYRILATDINETVLQIGQTGVYTAHQAAKIPQELKKRYCRRSRDQEQETIRFRPDIRERILFRKLNLMNQSYGLKRQYQVVFCRNVFIYFDRQTQRAVLDRLYKAMEPGGYLFMGHSENIGGCDLPLRSVASAVYQKPL